MEFTKLPSLLRSTTLRTPKNRAFSSNRGFSTCLVIGEHDTKKLNSATLNTITAAKQLSPDITVFLAGNFKGNNNVAKQAAKIEGVSKVIVADNEKFTGSVPEVLTPIVSALQKQFKSSYLLAPSSTFGKNLMPRVAAVLDVSAISDIISIKSPDTFVRAIYAGNALATVKSTDNVKVITVRSTAFEKAKEKSSESEIQPLAKESDVAPSGPVGEWIKDEVKESSRPDLQSARIVVSGGRALKSAENFTKFIEPLADQLGAAVGASRAAVDAGYVSNDLQVGQTGKIVAPELYLAVGISGAIQHLAGMKDSKVIVAINNDAEAPIFQVSDYGVVADLFQAVPEMTQILKKAKQT